MVAYRRAEFDAETRQAFGSLLRHRRLELGRTQGEVARRMGFDRKMPARYEAGAVPVEDHLPQVALAYELSLNDLYAVLHLPAAPHSNDGLAQARLTAVADLAQHLSPERWEAWVTMGHILAQLP